MDRVGTVLKLIEIVGAIAAAALPFIPIFWSQPEKSRRDQTTVAVVVVVACLFGWPFDLTDCSLLRRYAIAAAIFLVMTVSGFVMEKRIRGRWGRRQMSNDDSVRTSRWVIAGPDLSAAAEDQMKRNPLLSEQDVFEALGEDPLRVWLPKTREPILRWYELSEVFRVLGSVLAILAGIAWSAIRFEVSHAQGALTITPSTEQILFAGGPPMRFTAAVHSCTSEVNWKVVGPPSKEGNEWGEIFEGLYTPPAKVDHPFDVIVVATSADDKRDHREVTIQLRSHPSDSSLYKTELVAANGDSALVGVEILNEDHAWCYEKTALPLIGGAALINRMAAQHVFDGYNDIICVGAASHEHVTEAAEDNRARERADVLGHWVRDAVGSNPVRIHALKIGRYVSEEDSAQPSGGDASARERLVVIVGIKRIIRPIDLKKALRDAFNDLRSQHPIFSEYLDHYPEQQWELFDVLPNTKPYNPSSESCASN